MIPAGFTSHSVPLPWIPRPPFQWISTAFSSIYIPVHDGIWSLCGIDDDRPVAMWSRPRAERYDQRLREATERERIADWALADVSAKGLPVCITKTEETLATARADRAWWSERVRVIQSFKPE